MTLGFTAAFINLVSDVFSQRSELEHSKQSVIALQTHFPSIILSYACLQLLQVPLMKLFSHLS